MHDEATPIVEPPRQPTARPPCYQIGVHVCRPLGDRLWKFRNCVSKGFKIAFPRGSEREESLVGRCIVVKFSAFRAPTEDPWLLRRLANVEFAQELRSDFCFHVAYMCLSPHVFMLRRMDFIKAVDEELHLKAKRSDLIIIQVF